MFGDLAPVLRQIEPLDADWIQRAETRQASLTKPPGSLGRLEDIASRIVAIQRSLTPTVERARILVFAADHGVTAEGVAPYPSAVTGQMVANFLAGGAGVNALARVAGAEVRVVDIGVASDLRMRLGEGTGSALAFVVRAAVAAFTEMATFASAGVSNRSDLPDAVV
jgi:nicotinate-nucleotide--dimethylbenzimidazole phosphoribosyltransferase